MYVFSSPVYCKNKVGDYELIDNTFTDKIDSVENGESYAYTNKMNDVKTYLPNKLSSKQGILIKQINNIMVVPNIENSINCKKVGFTNVFDLNSESLEYNDVFFEGTKLNASLTDFGTNLELLIKSKPKKNNFEYKINIENVFADISTPNYILFRNKNTKDIIFIIYAPDIYDSKNNVLNSTMLIREEKSGVFSLKVILDIKNKDVNYPIKINQSFHMYKSHQPDSTVYSKSIDTGYYLDNKLNIGNDPIRGEGQTFVRFEVLSLLNIDPKDILSANYIGNVIRDVNDEAKITLLPVVSDWCSLNVRWNSRAKTNADFKYSNSISERREYKFDVTKITQLWLQNKNNEEALYSIGKGFLMINENPNNCVTFASGDNGMFKTALEIKINK
jgi:hypothetical protein